MPGSLFAQLLGDGKTLMGAVGVLPGVSNVACDVVAKAGQFLASYLRLKIGGLGTSAVEKSVENGDVDIQADGAIPVGNLAVSNGSFPYDT